MFTFTSQRSVFQKSRFPVLCSRIHDTSRRRVDLYVHNTRLFNAYRNGKKWNNNEIQTRRSV